MAFPTSPFKYFFVALKKYRLQAAKCAMHLVKPGDPWQKTNEIDLISGGQPSVGEPKKSCNGLWCEAAQNQFYFVTNKHLIIIIIYGLLKVRVNKISTMGHL